MIYLDNSATTYPKPEVVYEALDYANRNLAFNAGRGSYKEAQTVSDIISETRQLLADLVGASATTVSFESSATEALNIIIQGLPLTDGDTVYVSPFEHNSVVRPLYLLQQKKGIQVKVIPFDKKTWKLKENELSDMFALNKPAAVFASHISNVTGYILPFEMIFNMSHKYNAINVLDCSQSLGVLNPKVDDVDLLVFAGHKSLYASFGVAGFMNLSGKCLNVVKAGGTGSDSLNPEMPSCGNERYESGSLNGVAVYGLNASLKWGKTVDVLSHERKLTSYLISELSKLEKVHMFIPENTDNSILGIVSFVVEGYSSSDVGSILAEEFDICVRTGYHCAPFVHSFVQSTEYSGTVRASVGAFTEKEDIKILVEALKSL